MHFMYVWACVCVQVHICVKIITESISLKIMVTMTKDDFDANLSIKEILEYTTQYFLQYEIKVWYI